MDSEHLPPWMSRPKRHAEKLISVFNCVALGDRNNVFSPSLPFFYTVALLVDAWLPLKYELVFCRLCLARWQHRARLLSILLRVGALFEKILLQFSQHGLNCLLSLQCEVSVSAR